jgi:hypothetical protein
MHLPANNIKEIIKAVVGGFDEIEKGYDGEIAHKESLRCLQCDSRLKISSVKLPPKRCSTKGGW